VVLRKALFIAVFQICLVGLLIGQDAQADDLNWRSESFERVSVDEDVKNVLRGILRQNGQQVIFREGVEGSVTYEFENMSLRAAFNKLLIENSLEYVFDSSQNLVTVFLASESKSSQAFVPLKHATPDQVRSAVDRFDLGGSVTVDPDLKTAFIRGTPEQVKPLQDLIQRLDDAEGARVEARLSRERETLERQKLIAEERLAAEEERLGAEKLAIAEREARDKLARQQRLLEQFARQEIKVIPVRYANVGDTTKVFSNDESVTVPGIDSTLRKLLGGERERLNSLTKEEKELLDEFFPDRAISQPVISVDRRTNSVIVRGTPNAVAKVEDMVQKLDKPVPMVEMEVMIIIATEDVKEELGVLYAGEQTIPPKNVTALGDSPARFAGFNSGITNANPGTGADAQNANATDGVNAGLGGTPAIGNIDSASQALLAGFVIQGERAALQVQLDAFEQENRTQTIAAPRITTLNNVTSRVEETASQLIVLTAAGNTGQSVEEVDLGLQMDITPSVIAKEDAAEQDLIRMSVTARNTSLNGNVNVNAGNAAATTQGQEIQTEVIIPDGRTYVMGGLYTDTLTDNEKGIPLLKDIPIFGQLFRQDSDADNFSEVLFFITPKIVYPHAILPRDIAERRYLERRKERLKELRGDLQATSLVLDNIQPEADEDE